MQSGAKKITILGCFIWSIAAIFYLYEFFLRTFVGSIASDLIHDLHLSIAQFTYISASYYVAYSIMQIPVGILADKFGVKKIMVFATLMCAFATILFAHVDSYMAAILARFLMGFASSFAFVCLLIIAVNWFPKRFFGLFSGLSQFVGTMGPALAGGPFIAWLTATHTSWRTLLSYVGLFGIVLALLALIFVKAKPGHKSGTLLFIKQEKPIRARLTTLLKNKQAWFIASYSMTVYVSISVFAAVWGTNYLESRGLTQSTAAYMMTIMWVSFALACPLLGFLSDTVKRRKLFLMLCAFVGLIGISLLLYSHFSSTLLYACLFAMLGFAGSGQSLAFASIAENSSADVKATAIGLNNSLMTFAGALFPLIIGVVITHVSHTTVASNLTSGELTIGLSILTASFFVASLISTCLIKETYCKPQLEMILLQRPDASDDSLSAANINQA